MRAPQPGQDLLDEPLRSRWSASVFDPTHELGHDDLQRLLEAARWAPSAGNSQPWRFVVAIRGSLAHKLLVEHLSRGNAGWVPRASAVFLAVAQVGDPEDLALTYSDYAVYDLGQAAAHLTVEAAHLGLHVHQFAGFDHDALTEAFGIPPHFRLMTGIAVGRHGDPDDVPEHEAAREQRPRERRPVAEIAFTATWGEPFAP